MSAGNNGIPLQRVPRNMDSLAINDTRAQMHMHKATT